MKKALLLSIFLISLVLLTPIACLPTPTQVTDNTYADNAPQIAIDSLGNSYLAWQGKEGGGDNEIFWAKVDSLGVVTIKQVTDNTYEDNNPEMAVDTSGNTYLTWYGKEGGGDNEIFWAKLDSTGTVTASTQVTTNSDDDKYPKIAIDSSGNSYLTWYGYAGGADYETFWAKVDSLGVVISAQVTANTYDDYNPQIVVDSSGNSYITWYVQESDYEIFWARVDSSGMMASKPITANTYHDYNPQIAIDSSGNSYLAWQGREGGGDNEIFWAKLDYSGTVTDTTQVTTNTFSDESPQIAIDSSGDSFLTWLQDDGVYETFWAKLDSSGTVTDTTQVTTTTSDNDSQQIEADSTSNSYLTWFGNDGSDYEVFLANVNSSGTSTTTQVTTNDYADYYSKIAIDSSGNSYLTWYGYFGGAGSDSEIFFVMMPFPDSEGPTTSGLNVDPLFLSNGNIHISATIDDGLTGDSKIVEAEYFFDSVGANSTGNAMVATDGTFDEASEGVDSFFDVSALGKGVHTVYVHGKDEKGNWGQCISREFYINRFRTPALMFPLIFPNLSFVNGLYDSIKGDLPYVINEDIAFHLDQAQAHMNNAITLSNPVMVMGAIAKACAELQTVYDSF